MDLIQAVVELLRKAATDLPGDVEKALAASLKTETDPMPSAVLEDFLENVRIAREEGRPICQDTGVPIFFVTAARGTSNVGLLDVLKEAVRRATREVPLRPNAIDIFTGRNTGDGVGDGIPVVYYSEWQQNYTMIDLLLKGGGSENVGVTCKLPDPALGAQRDIEGIRRCVVDAVHKAQGRGCPPYIVAVGVGGTKDDAALLAKRQLLRRLDEPHDDREVAAMEERLLDEINSLGIGPAGLSGRTTALAVKMGVHARAPATFFVEVAFGCWAHRRWRMRFRGGKVTYE
jgi:fumarate hydratase class I